MALYSAILKKYLRKTFEKLDVNLYVIHEVFYILQALLWVLVSSSQGVDLKKFNSLPLEKNLEETPVLETVRHRTIYEGWK